MPVLRYPETTEYAEDPSEEEINPPGESSLRWVFVFPTSADLLLVYDAGMELVLPSAEYKTSYIEAVKEFQTGSDINQRAQQYGRIPIAELEADFDAYVEKIRSHARGENLPEGYIPSTELWLVDGGEFIGRLSIRHQLTDILKKFGGHIGYDIRPSQRNKGYGSKILELALPKAKELGLSRVLITCDETNVASRKIIEKNGGVFENQLTDPAAGTDKLRFWVETR